MYFDCCGPYKTSDFSSGDFYLNGLDILYKGISFTFDVF